MTIPIQMASTSGTRSGARADAAAMAPMPTEPRSNDAFWHPAADRAFELTGKVNGSVARPTLTKCHGSLLGLPEACSCSDNANAPPQRHP